MKLTTRQSEVLRHLATGLSIASIAEHLEISTRMVDSHIYNAKRNLDARTTEQAVAIAVKLNLIDID